MNWTHHQAILATIAYAYVFEYSLTRREVLLWLIGKGSISSQDIQKVDKAFFSQFVATKKIRAVASRKKWALLPKILPYLIGIPTLQLIGVSGGLAMNNARKEDDIDLFFIVRPGTIWISRLCVLIVLELSGRRRKVGESIQQDKFCPNMFVTSTHMALPISERDLYSAHEVLQMKPLFSRKSAYTQFLEANNWVALYLPYAWKEKEKIENRKEKEGSMTEKIFSSFSYFLFPIFYFLDYPAKVFQLWHMRANRTTEVVTDHISRFHPRDTRTYIQQKYIALLKKYKVPLDSPFLKSLQ